MGGNKALIDHVMGDARIRLGAAGTTRRPHRDTNAGSDAHQRSFTRAGDRPLVAAHEFKSRLLRCMTSKEDSRYRYL
jgi:hypothetical protein